MHYVYKITCTTTNKFYIGVHSTQNMDDGYLGSGVIIRRSVAKYGPDDHLKEVLRLFSSAEQAYQYESEIVTEASLKNPLCMNIKPGGIGGWGTSEDQSRRAHKANAKMKILKMTDPEWVTKRSKASTAGLNRAYAAGRQATGAFGDLQSEMSDRAKSDVSREKRQATYAKIGHSQGEKNSQFGTYWVIREGPAIKIPQDHLEQYLRDGYRRGRK